MSDIEIINRSRALAIAANGERLPITDWFDDDGDDCGPETAVVAIAGPDHDGKWYSIDLRAFEKAFLN